MLVLFYVKNFFRKIFWRVRKCKADDGCGRFVLISKKDVKCTKKITPILIICGMQYKYGYYCPNCGKYNYISNFEIPKEVQLDIRIETKIK